MLGSRPVSRELYIPKIDPKIARKAPRKRWLNITTREDILKDVIDLSSDFFSITSFIWVIIILFLAENHTPANRKKGPMTNNMLGRFRANPLLTKR